MDYRCLLSPGKIGTLTVKNRILMAPMSVYLANIDGTVSDELIAFYEARAKGGAGMIVTEYAYVNPSGKSCQRQTAVDCDEMIPGLKCLVDAVHNSGALIGLQLQHGGRRSIVEKTAPSPIPMVMGDDTPRVYTAKEVYGLIDDFVAAAVRAKKAGFDMVEIHCAHGYLLSDFVSPRSNRRTDEFGGGLEGRANVVVQIIRRIKAENGSDYPVSIRLSGDELSEDGHKKRDAAAMALLLEEAGADLINVSCGVAGVGQAIAPAARETGHNVEAAEEIKNVVECAVAVAGRITEPVYAEAVLRSGKAEFISIGRALLADPDFVNKAAAGQEEEIAPCVGCLQRCYHEFGHGGSHKGCMVNPFALRETRFIITPAEQKKHILIVGAGPSGLETAWIAAKRGHKVQLYDKNDMPGGQLRIAAVPPHKQPLARAVCYYRRMCEKYGVEICYNTAVDKELILRQKPDVVVLATGGVPIRPGIPGINDPGILDNSEVLLGAPLKGKKVLILGGGLHGAETADYLAQFGYDITVVEMREGIAMTDPEATRNMLLERLEKGNVKLLTSMMVKHVYNNGAVCETNGMEIKLFGFDHVIIAFGARSWNPLETQLEDFGGKLIVLGDAYKAANTVEAIYRGTELGLSL